MGKKPKKDKKNKAPWSSQFGGDDLDKTQHSRSARHSNKKDVAPLSKVLLFLFFALLIIPFATYYLNERAKNEPTPKSTEEVMISKQSSSEESSSDDSEADSQESQSDESVADTSSEVESAESESKPETNEEPESSAESVIPPATNEEEVTEPELPADTVYTNTYTIQAGDNLYRIALNHGMTLDELMEANNLTSDVAIIGVTLKVK